DALRSFFYCPLAPAAQLSTLSLHDALPILPSEVEQYDRHVTRRLLVKPGITGLWQVSGRSDLPWDETVRLDLYYVDHWSPTMDRSEEHTSELQSREKLVCRLLLEKKKAITY